MAITTENKRRAAMLGGVLPVADGNIRVFDRGMVVGLYSLIPPWVGQSGDSGSWTPQTGDTDIWTPQTGSTGSWSRQ